MKVRLAAFLVAFTPLVIVADVPLSKPPIGSAPYYRSAIQSASNGRGFLVVSQESGDRFAACVMRVDMQGQPIDPVMLPVSDPRESSRVRAVASDGDSYLVAYTVPQTPSVIRFARVDDRGGITNGGTLAGNGDLLRLAWGGTAYVATYVDESLNTVAAVIASDGSVLRSDVRLLEHSYFLQDVRVCRGAGNSVLMTWVGSGGVIYATVAATSSLRDGTYSVPADVEIVGNANSDAIAASGDQSIVVWMTGGGVVPTTFHARRLDANGHPLGPPFDIVALDRDYYVYFDVAWNGSAFIVAYSVASEHQAKIVAISPDDRVISLRTYSNSGSFPVVSLAGSGVSALVTWNDNQLDAAVVGSGPDPVIGETTLVGLSSAVQRDPRVAWCGDEYRAVWIEQATQSRAVFGRIRADGSPAGNSRPIIDDSGGEQYGSSIACNASSALVVWTELDPGKNAFFARAAMVDAAGTHAALELGRPLSGPAVVWNGSEFLTAWQAPTREIMLARIASDGRLIDAIPSILRPARGSFGDASPSIAWNGSEYLVGWSSEILDVRAGMSGPQRLHAIDVVRMTRALTIDGPITTISPQADGSGSDAQSPLVIAGNGGWGVAWRQRSLFGTDYVETFAFLTPLLGLAAKINLGDPASGPSATDGAFSGGLFRLVFGKMMVMLDAQSVTKSQLDGVVAISHGNGPPLVIVSRISDEGLARLYIPSGGRTRAARH